jgi:hypothetical protein
MSRFDAGAAVPADRTKRSAGTRRPNDAAGVSKSGPVRDDAGSETGRRDLVVVNPKQTPPKGKPSRYGDALFLAHMFASKFDAPQQREKRRADPADANASYRNGDRQPAKPGRILSKKI